MALYRVSLRTISRGRGQLAVATAAYISGDVLYLESEHWTYDWSWRAKDVAHSELFGAHGWSREELWNEAEWAEGRWDGVTARELILALPHELSLPEQIALACEFAEWLSDRYGVAADLAVHLPNVRGGQDERNVHAHLMFTVRGMSPEGLRDRTEVWDDMKTGGPELKMVRAEWRRMYNEALERAGLEIRVDERSYTDQGLERLPGVHLGPVRSELERAGSPTEAGDYNRRVELLNRIRAAIGPELDWDWQGKAKTFSDKDGHRAYSACRGVLFRLRQSEATLEQDPRALSSDQRREIRVLRKELVALQDVLRPFRDAVREERIRRRKLHEQEKKRSRGKSGRSRTE